MSLLSLLPLGLVAILIACFVKLSARILRRSTVSWKHSFMFGGMLCLLTLGRLIFLPALPEFIPPLLATAIGAGLVVALGTWFFSGRAISADGKAFGSAGSAKLSALTVGLVFLVSLSLLVLVSLLGPNQT